MIAVRTRTAQVPAFGRLLKNLRLRQFRGEKTPEHVARLLATHGVRTTGPSLRGYEAGWNKLIDPVVLAGLATIYRTPLTSVVAVLAANRRNPTLSDFEVEQLLRAARSTYEAQAIASARFADVGSRLEAISAELGAFASDAAELTTPTADAVDRNDVG